MTHVTTPAIVTRVIPMMLFAIVVLVSQSGVVNAQWTTSGNNVTNTNSGNVGVGTSSPISKLHVNKTIRIDDDSGNANGSDTLSAAPALYLGTTSGGGQFQFNGNGGLDLWQHNGGWARTFTFTKSGSLGIGTNSPQNALDVNGSLLLRGNTAMSNQASVGPVLAAGYYGTGGYAFVQGYNYTTSQHIQLDIDASKTIINANSGGNVGIGTTSPTSNLEVQGVDGPLTLSQAGVTGKVTLQAAGGTDLHLSANAKYLSSTWNRFDTSLPSWNVFASSLADFAGIRRASAASGAITWIDFFRVTSAGNVGIGTTSPLQKLQVGSSTPTATTTPDAISLGGTYSSTARANAKLRLYDDNNGYVYGLGVSAYQFDFMAPAAAHYVWSVAGVEKMRLESDGTVTIAGSIAAKYQDVAEWVESSQTLLPGTVVVLDQSKSNQVIASFEPYDTRVAGVVSAQPGIALGEKGNGKVLVATTGRVMVKVDASRAPILVGDLLVTSECGGAAMKSEPLIIGGRKMHAPGTIIGKALQPLPSGTGEILTLLSLQ